MKKCLIFLEKHYETDCLGLLGAVQELYGDAYESTAVYLDADPAAAEGQLDEIVRIQQDSEQSADVRTLALVLEKLQDQKQFDCILIAATHFGRMLAPYLAALLGCGLVADVTEVRRTEEDVEMIRPAFGGRLMAVIEKTGSGPVMMSVRPGVFFTQEQNRETVYSEFIGVTVNKKGVVLLERRPKPERKDIRKSEILVSGGGGAMEHFDLLQELAERLGGAVSASRKAVDSGKADRVIQVGQSGRFVRPRLYIAEGIYGAVQHVAGIRHADHIIAVNTDPLAPICSLADIVVEGDTVSFTEKLIRRIDKEKES